MLTNGGRQSSACLRRTEKPPWVLVSEAVRVLQNEWTVHLSGSGSGASGLEISLCWLMEANNKKEDVAREKRESKCTWKLCSLQKDRELTSCSGSSVICA